MNNAVIEAWEHLLAAMKPTIETLDDGRRALLSVLDERRIDLWVDEIIAIERIHDDGEGQTTTLDG